MVASCMDGVNAAMHPGGRALKHDGPILRRAPFNIGKAIFLARSQLPACLSLTSGKDAYPEAGHISEFRPRRGCVANANHHEGGIKRNRSE
jgi:hypothetical protein